MVLHMSSLFLRTLREDPADAEVPSHRLPVRACHIRRVSPGVYTWLPLGLRVLRNVEQVVREEMDAIGSQEPALPGPAAQGAVRDDRPVDGVRRQHLPAHGSQGGRPPPRADARGDAHLACRTSTRSYKDLPLSIHQIQTKYRDEARRRVCSAAASS